MKAYSYKDSGIEWLGAIPSHWKADRVKDISSLRDQKTRVKLKDENYLELENIEQGTGKVLSFQNTLEVSSAVMEFKEGDVLFGKLRPYLEKYYLAEKDGYCTGEILAIEPVKINGKFLKYFLASPNFIKQCTVFSYGTKMPRVNWQTQIGVFSIPVPPPSEQKAIVDFLDRAIARIDRIVSVKEEQLEGLNTLLIAKMQEATLNGLDKSASFKKIDSEWIESIPNHWSVQKVKRICTVFRGKFTHRPRNDPRFYNGKYPFIQTGSITNTKKYIYEYTQTLNELGLSVSQMFPKGTLCMTIAGNIGDLAILNFDACFPDSIVGFSPSWNVDLDFLYYQFEAIKQDFLSTAIVTTQMNLNINRIGSVNCYLPPLEEQKQIVEYLDELNNKVDLQKNNLHTQIEVFKKYRKSLIHECVTGKKQVADRVE
jgi:type I restriction enzyme S subunit